MSSSPTPNNTPAVVPSSQPPTNGQPPITTLEPVPEKSTRPTSTPVVVVEEDNRDAIINEPTTEGTSNDSAAKSSPPHQSFSSKPTASTNTSFAANKAKLARSIASDAVSSSLSTRPPLDSLINSNIIEPRPVAPILQAVAKRLERTLISDSLNQKLYSRQDITENQNVYKGKEVAPRLRGARVALERNRIRDQIAHRLEARPQPQQLVRDGILPKGTIAEVLAASADADVLSSVPSISSRLAGVARQLERNLTSDKLGHLLEKRSQPHSLLTSHILVSDSSAVAPALQGPQRSLAKNLARANLYHALRHRPTIGEMQERGILLPGDVYLPPKDSELVGQTYAQKRSSVNSANGELPIGYRRGRVPGPSPKALQPQNIPNKYEQPGEQTLDPYSQQGRQSQAAAYAQYYTQQYEQDIQQQQQQQKRTRSNRRATASSVPTSSSVPSTSLPSSDPSSFSSPRRSVNFHSTRLLLRSVCDLYGIGILSFEQKSYLKDLIVDQDANILQIAQQFDVHRQQHRFIQELTQLATN